MKKTIFALLFCFLLTSFLSVFAQDSDLTPENWREWPILPESVSPEMKELYQRGITQGNSPTHFSKIGDSNTITLAFLGCFDGIEGTNYVLGPYTDLAEVISHFQWSFSRATYGANVGATAYDLNVDYYEWANDQVCWPYESPAACEYRVHVPSIAFIAVGTNDAYMDLDFYEYHLSSLVQKTLDKNIVPILMTKMDDIEGDGSFNRITAKIAMEKGVPLVNLWKAARVLPNFGLKEGDVHPTSSETCFCDFSGDDVQTYGWTMRNLVSLEALDKVWRLLNE